MKVLACDMLSDSALTVFEDSGIQLRREKAVGNQALVEMIGGYDGIIVGEGVYLSEDLLNCATRLKAIGAIGRAIDNVDIRAAGRRGIVVMSRPEGAALAIAEHAIAMMTALCRRIPQAFVSVREGRWERDPFLGLELYKRVLGLVGAGRVGRMVAERARGLKMKVIAYDPYIKTEVMERLDIEPVSFEELLSRSDIVSIHAPQTKETRGLFNKESLTRMKKGALIINCAHPSIVEGDALWESMVSGHLGGAAVDGVLAQSSHRLLGLPNFLCTPGIAAFSDESFKNLSRGLAEDMAAYLLHGTVRSAINVPVISPELMGVLGPYVSLTERIGLLQAQLAEGAFVELEVMISGAITEHDTSPIVRAAVKGLFTPVLGERVNYVNAPLIAEERGVRIKESRTRSCEDFSSLVSVSLRTLEGLNVVSGTIFGERMPRILRINDFSLEAVPEGHLLFILSQDRPGVIGLIGSTLGRHGININRMNVGQRPEGLKNIILLTTGTKATEESLKDLRALPQVDSVRTIEL